MHTQRNRRSPRVPNEPWRGPGNLTIPQTVALLAAVLLAVALWWVSGYLPGATTFSVLATRMLTTGLAGGIAAVLFYAAADSNREPFVRQHMTYSFRRHTYRKEPVHGTDPLPCAPHRPRAAGSPMRRARACVAAAIHAIVAALPGRHTSHEAS